MDILKAPVLGGNFSSEEPWPDFETSYIREKQTSTEDVYREREHWRQTGEGSAPNHVATLKLSSEHIELLQSALTFPYHYIDPRAIAEDDQIAALGAAEEELPTISPDARRLLRQIVEQFNWIVDQDLDMSGIKPAGESHLLMQAGVYDDNTPDLHVDSVGVFSIRHGITLVGSGTNWLLGNLDSSLFDENGEYTYAALPPNPKAESEAGVVEQFASECYPHIPPLVTAPEFRITIFRSTPLELTPLLSTK